MDITLIFPSSEKVDIVTPRKMNRPDFYSQHRLYFMMCPSVMLFSVPLFPSLTKPDRAMLRS